MYPIQVLIRLNPIYLPNPDKIVQELPPTEALQTHLGIKTSSLLGRSDSEEVL